MKTSKIIFISLLSTIAFLILAALVDIRINGKPIHIKAADLKVNKHSVPSFKVLYISSSKNINLIQNDSSFIEETWQPNSPVPLMNYTLRGDTLMISDLMPSTYNPFPVKIYYTNSLKKIFSINSSVSMKRFGSQTLSLDLDKSIISFNQDKNRNSAMTVLNIVAKNHSNINVEGFKVDSLGIFLEHSEVSLKIISKKISGTLSDYSKITVWQSEEISLKKDATSKINVSDF